ncbi:putative membrane protein [Minicystis rosea]|nr:putative membrane protein [Minicystis rosea]
MRARMILAALAAVVCLLLASLPARAHDVRGTAVYLDVGERAVAVEMVLPVEQLALALALGVAVPPNALPASEEELASYVRAHLSARSKDGRPFHVEVQRLRRERATDDGDDVIAEVTMRAPPGASARWLELREDAIVHRVVTHNIYVFVRRDLARGAVGDAVEPVGLIHWQSPTVTVDREGGSLFRGLGAVFVLGLKHIAEGTDHLLFLFMLLLVAPLAAQGGRWAARGPATRSIREAAKIVTAFTVGHSLTLIAVTLAGASLPSRPVEILIALSIAISAAHAIRPLFAGREVVLAIGFGLIHGLGFAEALRGFGFDGVMLGLSLVGFNLGVEAMQLAVVLVLLPWLLLVGRTVHYARLRNIAAVFGAIAALGWIAERAFGLATPIPALVAAIAARPGWIAVGLLLTAALATAAHLPKTDLTAPRARLRPPSA